MSSLFDDLQQGLQEAIQYAKGDGPAKKTVYEIMPVTVYNNEQIRRIRMDAKMTQRTFADYLGVSVKTVEAWERGRSNPTGPALRLLALLACDQIQALPFIRRIA